MSKIQIPDFESRISTWLNWGTSPDSSAYRKINMVDGDGHKLYILYSISYKKAYRENTGGMRLVASLAKLICPLPLITGSDYLKEDTSCILSLELLRIDSHVLYFSYDISVCNGSSIHKKVVGSMETSSLEFEKKKHPAGFMITDSELCIDLKKRSFLNDYNIIRVNDVTFNGNDCWISC